MEGGGALPPQSPHQGSALDRNGDLGGPQTPRRIWLPLTPKPGSSPQALNGIIFPSLNPAKFCSSFPNEHSQQKVWQFGHITCSVINTSNKV